LANKPGGAVALAFDVFGCEESLKAIVAKLSNGKERAVAKFRENVGGSGRERELWHR
jgi:hypothetical protein